MYRPDSKRLTVLGSDGTPKLKNGLKFERAIALLYDYENTGAMPKEILDLKETVLNLRERVKKLEDWQ